MYMKNHSPLSQELELLMAASVQFYHPPPILLVLSKPSTEKQPGFESF